MAVEEEAPAQEAETNLPTAQLEAPAEGLQTNAQQQLPLAAAVDTPEQQDQVVATGDTDTTVVNITASVSEPAEAETSTHPTRATPAATSDLQQSVASAEETGTALAEVQADASVPFPALESSGTESDKTVSPDVAADSSGDRVAATPNAVPADQSTGDSANAASAVADAMESPPLGFANTTFTVPTEKWQHQQSVPLATTAAEIKHSLCSNWNIAETALSVKYADQEMQDAESLHSCGIQVLVNPPCLPVWPCVKLLIENMSSWLHGVSVQAGANVEIELVIHYQLLATKRKSEAAPKVANLPEVHRSL